ncbi:hypothetical protein [Acinetobacter sp. ANC 4648]|uniref:hypothetical protein n=1 Tax=Acinetobacter sp. ANC 4648 TaxID=1977875 RepID=UPI000A34728E|nr:hypothetical protein [Acinetobacter sp. ANC 4648]OTG80282.1 hypothetical protein B9T27_12985 [Acinetobacter sp. ANC 4648]
MSHSISFEFLIDLFESTLIDRAKILQRLGLKSVKDFDQSLNFSLALRLTQTTQHQYIVQTSTLENSLSYLFSPFINSILNQKTVYIAPRQNIVERVYSEYFRLDALDLNKRQILLEMDLDLDLVSAAFNPTEFQFYALAKALLDPNCQHIFFIGQSSLDDDIKKQIVKTVKINIDDIEVMQGSIDVSQIDFKKLFWKKKSVEIAELCRSISHANAPLISQQFNLKLSDAERLIDDLMYSEHLLEKLSVFGEFTETIFKHAFKSEQEVYS